MDPTWRDVVVAPDLALSDALQTLDRGGFRVLLVADAQGKLLGTLTDGDVRRALLKQTPMTSMVAESMHASPRVARVGESPERLRALMETHSLLHIPLVDQDGRIAGLETLHSVHAHPDRDAWVFLMAGGFGTRLRPLTNNCPKPMLKVGGKPILETILERCIAAGFYRFFISVHYLPEQIKGHFSDGSRWGVEIRYIEEDVPLGTAGALGLLPEIGDRPVILMNGDVLTQLDVRKLYEFHCSREVDLTLSVREYDMQVPFGVVESDGELVTSIVEKPVHRFYVNAGIYVVSPAAVARARPARRLDMPDLIRQLIDAERQVAMFPVHEYWLDVGRPDDFQIAQTGVYD